VLAGPDGSNPRRVPLVLNVGPGQDTVLTPSSGPVFSPDGQLMAFLAASHDFNSYLQMKVYIADTTGRVLRAPSYPTCIYPHAPVIAYPWTSSVGWARQGRWLAFVCNYPGGAWHTLILYDDSDSLKLQLQTPARPGAESWSPDGKWILDGSTLVTIDKRVTSVSINQNPLGGTSPSGFTGLGWSLDSRLIVGPTGDCGTGVYLMWPVSGAPLQPVLGAPYRSVEFSPDGKKLLAMASTCSAADVPTVTVLDRATLKPDFSIRGAVWATWRP